jgi:hypothetical protein
LPGGVYPIQVRQADINKNQVGLQVLRFPHSLEPVHGFADDFQAGPLFQRRPHESPEGFEIFDKKYPRNSHLLNQSCGHKGSSAVLD